MPIILDNKYPSSPSVFRPAALLRAARRQKALPSIDVPAVCVLDPDGDIVRRLRQNGQSTSFTAWPCYHTQLDVFVLAGRTIGIVGRRRPVRGLDRGGIVRQRLSSVAELDLGRANRAGGTNAVLCRHRPRAAR